MFCCTKRTKHDRLEDWIDEIDRRFPRVLADLVLQYVDTPSIELHVTREIVLARPMLDFMHVSVFNVRIDPKQVVFYAIADVRFACAFFELRLCDNLSLQLSDAFGIFPDAIVTAQDRSDWIQRFVQGTAGKRGIFHGSQHSDIFEVIACDGMSKGNGHRFVFRPGFNMFRIVDKRSFGASMRRVDPSRFY